MLSDPIRHLTADGLVINYSLEVNCDGLVRRMNDSNGTASIRRAPADYSAVVAWMRLARVYHKIDRRSAEAFRAAGLSTAQFDVLAQVGAREGCSQQELADRLLVTKGNVTQLLDKMESRGWIVRRPVTRGRGNELFLTEEGRRLRELVVPEQELRISTFLKSLDPVEIEQLGALLRKLDHSLD